MAADTRKLVLSMLDMTTRQGKLSHHVLADAFSDNDLSVQDRAFVSRLYIGTLERAVCIDYIIDSHCSDSKKIKPAVRNILRMGIYQMLFMDSVPDHAAINESVRLTLLSGKRQLKGFVNAVLRSIQRDLEDQKVFGDMPAFARYSVPEWIYDLLTDEYGKEKAEAFLEASLKEDKPLYIRPSHNEDKDSLIGMLEKEGCSVSKVNEECMILDLNFKGSPVQLEAFKKGLFFIQDPGSVMAAHNAAAALEKADSPLIVDTCAAPGGKSTYVAAAFPGGKVIARDISEEKAALIRENINRLGLTNIEVQVKDATTPDPVLSEKADLVICDVPCSGLGTIGGKPDIKLRLKKEDIESLAALARKILAAASDMVKPGGVLAFSTCTVTRTENRDNADWFENKFPFERISENQLLPSDGTDGFYCAVFKRKDI